MNFKWLFPTALIVCALVEGLGYVQFSNAAIVLILIGVSPWILATLERNLLVKQCATSVRGIRVGIDVVFPVLLIGIALGGALGYLVINASIVVLLGVASVGWILPKVSDYIEVFVWGKEIRFRASTREGGSPITSETEEKASENQHRELTLDVVRSEFRKIPVFKDLDDEHINDHVLRDLKRANVHTLEQLQELVSCEPVMEVLRNIYLEVLGRMPDPVGFAFHGGVLFEAQLNRNAVRAVRKAIQNSKEAQAMRE